jgi:hypothetical protein
MEVNMRDKTKKGFALAVFIDSPDSDDSVGVGFCATGHYTTSFGLPYIQCKIQGNTFPARVMDNGSWDCDCSGLTDETDVSLVAEIYAQQGGPLADSDSVPITIDSNIPSEQCPPQP